MGTVDCQKSHPVYKVNLLISTQLCNIGWGSEQYISKLIALLSTITATADSPSWHPVGWFLHKSLPLPQLQHTSVWLLLISRGAWGLKSHPWCKRQVITKHTPDEDVHRCRRGEMIGDMCVGVEWGVLNPAGGHQCHCCLHQLDANHSSHIL